MHRFWFEEDNQKTFPKSVEDVGKWLECWMLVDYLTSFRSCYLRPMINIALY